MSTAAAAESWEQWTSRVAGELAGLTDGQWLTVTAAPDGATAGTGATQGSLPYAAGAPERERRWSLRRGSTARPSAGRDPVADVFLQARLIDGVLALECISDTEFEGLSDLSEEQERALVDLGWEQVGHEPAFQRTFALDVANPAGPDTAASAPVTGPERDASEGQVDQGTPGLDENAAGAATDAARLLRMSLEHVLGALSPADVVLRRSPSHS
ncbi:MAG TPA: hypothetical protein VFN43_08860 [Humibacillus sp.]|nr:hypothetical protein [Humibacillus sp.]